MGSRCKKGSQNAVLSAYSQNLGNALSLQRARIAERAARVEAEQASKMKSTFIANMSHELRTPLNAILGFSEILQMAETKKIEAAQVAEFSGYIHDAADHLLAVVNSILNISKIESGTTILDVQDVTITEVLHSAMKFIEGRARESNIAIKQDYTEDLPIIRGDPVRLTQVYTNLLSNAVKFTPKGGCISVSASGFDDKKLIVTVGDTGIGMDSAEITTALSSFGQIDNELSRQQEGTGLGLAIAKGLIEQHGGHLKMTSEKGIGTVVATLLPVKICDHKLNDDGDTADSEKTAQRAAA